MNLDQAKTGTKVTLVAALVLMAGLFAGTTQAQSAYRGKFTIDYSIRWGRVLIPAGEYRFTLEALGSGSRTARVMDAKTGKNVALIPCSFVSDSQGRSELLLGRRGDRYVVHTVRLQDLGEDFVFDPQLASRQTREEGRQSDTAPVVVAKN